MSYFLQQGSTYKVISEADIGVTENLPVGTYVVKQPIPQLEELVLELIENFKPANKLYGDTAQRADRIIDTFLSRENSTGVLLAGEKGSGKTLLAREISIRAAQRGIPTILVNSPRVGDTFNQLIQSIKQPAIVLFDEFEKTYRESAAQESILTLLDGTFQTQKMFILTCNDVYALNAHMLNRPGRLYYYLQFHGLEESFIREYCRDALMDTSKIDSICTLANLFVEFNFDMLKAIVEELNRYGEEPHEVVKMLNTKPSGGNDGDFTVELVIPRRTVKPYYSKWSGNPLNSSRQIDIYFTENGSVQEDEEYVTSDDDEDSDTGSPARFRIEHLVKVDPEVGSYEYDNGTAKLKLTRIKASGTFDFSKVF